MTTMYNWGTGPTASLSTSQDGNTVISVKSGSPLKPKAIYMGTATLESRWVNSEKTNIWQFTPKLLDPTPLQYNEAKDDYQNQIISIEFDKKRIFPASGIIKTNLTGAINVFSVKFDLPHAYDLWVAILRSPWVPLKMHTQKSLLSISHSSTQVMAQIKSVKANSEEIPSLRADVLVKGEGFKKVWLSIKRCFQGASMEEKLGEMTNGSNTFIWKPTMRSFDTLLVTYSDMLLDHFLGLLKHLGAETQQSVSAMGSYLSNNFILCDGPGINYTLTLKGKKHILGYEEEKTTITLNP
jgi:hypothetical protein